MNNLLTALNGLIASLRQSHYQNGAPKGRGNEHTIRKKSGKTRRGATHKQGVSFKPVLFLRISPAEYRRTHKADPKKARAKFLAMRTQRNRARMQEINKKWISA